MSTITVGQRLRAVSVRRASWVPALAALAILVALLVAGELYLGNFLTPRVLSSLLLDNAYAEFCRHDYRPLLSRYPNLLIFRTFSKAWSLAGLRLGYLLADPRLVTNSGYATARAWSPLL